MKNILIVILFSMLVFAGYVLADLSNTQDTPAIGSGVMEQIER